MARPDPGPWTGRPTVRTAGARYNNAVRRRSQSPPVAAGPRTGRHRPVADTPRCQVWLCHRGTTDRRTRGSVAGAVSARGRSRSTHAPYRVANRSAVTPCRTTLSSTVNAIVETAVPEVVKLDEASGSDL